VLGRLTLVSAMDCWGISIHHALGGRPLWLVVNGYKK
jgi:hypothetical protein